MHWLIMYRSLFLLRRRHHQYVTPIQVRHILSHTFYIHIDRWTKSPFFKKKFLADTLTCPISGPLVPLFWISGDVSSRFQSQSVFCLICLFFLQRRMLCTFPEIHFWHYTCWPLDSWHHYQFCPHILFPADVRLLGFELMPSEYLWVRCSTNWAKLESTSLSHTLSIST